MVHDHDRCAVSVPLAPAWFLAAALELERVLLWVYQSSHDSGWIGDFVGGLVCSILRCEVI